MKEGLEELDESMIVSAFKLAPEEGNFAKALKEGFVYKQAGLKPIYIMDWDSGCITVTSEERKRKKLH